MACHGGLGGMGIKNAIVIDGIGWINKRPCRISTREYVENSKGACL